MAWTGSNIGTPEWYSRDNNSRTATYSSRPQSESAIVSYMWENHPQTSAFLYYSGFGLLDPKMPVEYRAFGPGYVAFNVLGLGALLWYVDPMDKREGGFAESDWYDHNIRQNQWQIGGPDLFPW